MIAFEELVYTNVEADVSQSGRTGFQVLTSSSGVTDLEKTEARNRLFYRPSRAEEEQDDYQEKHVFYRTRSDNFLLARITRLPEPDTAGRTGRFLAHALLLSPENFMALGNDPCPILRWFDGFFTTVQAAIDADLVDPATHRSRQAKTDLLFWRQLGSIASDQARVKNLALPAEMRRDLYLLSLQQAQDEVSRNALGFIGTPTQVLDQLSALFVLLPTSTRQKCTFDTFFRNGNLGSTPYWAVGLPPGSASSPRLFTFDIASGFFKYTRNAKTPFETWSARRVEFDLEDYVGMADATHTIFGWLDTENSSLPPLNQQKILQAWNILLEDPQEKHQIQQHLISLLYKRLATHHVGSTLAKEVLKKELEARHPKEEIEAFLTSELLRICQEQWKEEEIACKIEGLFELAKHQFPSQVLPEIRVFATATRRPYLLLMSNYQDGRLDSVNVTVNNLLNDELNRDYRRFLSLILSPFEINWMMAQIDESTFLGFRINPGPGATSDPSYQKKLWKIIFQIPIFSSRSSYARWEINMQQIAEVILENSALPSQSVEIAGESTPLFRMVEAQISQQSNYAVLREQSQLLSSTLQSLSEEKYDFHVDRLLKLVPAKINVYEDSGTNPAFFYGFTLGLEQQRRIWGSKVHPSIIFDLCKILVEGIGEEFDPAHPDTCISQISSTRWLSLMHLLASQYRHQSSIR